MSFSARQNNGRGSIRRKATIWLRGTKGPTRTKKPFKDLGDPVLDPPYQGLTVRNSRRDLQRCTTWGVKINPLPFLFFTTPNTDSRTEKGKRKGKSSSSAHKSFRRKEVGGDMFNVLSFSLRTCGFLS